MPALAVQASINGRLIFLWRESRLLRVGVGAVLCILFSRFRRVYFDDVGFLGWELNQLEQVDLFTYEVGVF